MFRTFANFFKCCRRRSNDESLLEQPLNETKVDIYTSDETILDNHHKNTRRTQYFVICTAFLAGISAMGGTAYGFGIWGKSVYGEFDDAKNTFAAHRDPANFDKPGYECSTEIMDEFALVNGIDHCIYDTDLFVGSDFYKGLSKECVEYCKYLKSLKQDKNHKGSAFAFLAMLGAVSIGVESMVLYYFLRSPQKIYVMTLEEVENENAKVRGPCF